MEYLEMILISAEQANCPTFSPLQHLIQFDDREFVLEFFFIKEKGNLGGV